MGLWLSQTDKILYKYLERAYNKQARQLDAAETRLVLELRQLEKEINVCVTEIITIRQVLEQMKVSDLFWVANNFRRISMSLVSQRKLVNAARLGMMGTKPNNDELQAILKLKPQIEDRLKYLHAVPIPENVLLTPLKEYVELSGAESFSDIIRKRFPTAKDMMDFQEDKEQMNLFIGEIIDELKQAGRENDYLPRLNEYIERNQQRIEKEKAEKAEAKRKEALREGWNGMPIFKDLFCKGIRTLEGSQPIRLSKQAISTHMAQGHRGQFCVLCCGFGNGKYVYRYVTEDGTLKNNFTNIGVYPTYAAANEAIVSFRDMWPDKAFEAVAI